MATSRTVNFTNEECYNWVINKAKEEDRSVSYLINRILTEAMEKEEKKTDGKTKK